MTNKALKYRLWTIGIIVIAGLCGYLILLTSFDLFNMPNKKILSYKWDHEGIRQAEVFRLEGNAVTNPSINVSINCNSDIDESKKESLIFTADESLIKDNDVILTWLTFDSLRIGYHSGLRVFTQRH
jgi:hypothetical protein